MKHYTPPLAVHQLLVLGCRPDPFVNAYPGHTLITSLEQVVTGTHYHNNFCCDGFCHVIVGNHAKPADLHKLHKLKLYSDLSGKIRVSCSDYRLAIDDIAGKYEQCLRESYNIAQEYKFLHGPLDEPPWSVRGLYWGAFLCLNDLYNEAPRGRQPMVSLYSSTDSLCWFLDTWDAANAMRVEIDAVEQLTIHDLNLLAAKYNARANV
jgi:hypothetical protein